MRPAVDDEDLVVGLEDHAVHSDFAQAPERDDLQRTTHQCLGHTRRGDDFGRDIGFVADDQVGVRSGRFQELVMHRSDCIVVLADDAIQTSSSLSHVAMQAADEADVRLDVEINFDVEKVADLRVPERVDPLHQNRVARTDQSVSAERRLWRKS